MYHLWHMRSFIYIGSLLTIFSCASPKSSAELDAEKIYKEIQLMFDNYHKDVAAGGLKAEFKYLDSTANFYWVPPGYNMPLSYDSVKQILIENDKALAKLTLHWDTLRIMPLTNDLVNYTGIVKGQMKDTSGATYQLAIIESGIVTRRANGWKLLCGQSANIENGMD